MNIPPSLRRLALGLAALCTAAPLFGAIGYDTTFQPEIPEVGWESYRCTAVAVEADGRILSGGSAGLVRLERTGARVPGLAPVFAINGQPSTFIYQIVVLDDGDIVVRGDFNEVNGQQRPGLARLNADGSLDGSPAVLLEDGEMVTRAHAGGNGSYFLGTSQPVPEPPFHSVGRLRRVLADGSMDPSFVLDLAPGPGQPVMRLPTVQEMATDAQGRIYAGGAVVDVPEEFAVVRLLPDGRRDPAWNGRLHGAFNPVEALYLEPGGGLLVGGEFRGLARLDAAGEFDTAYEENLGWIEQAGDPLPMAIVPVGATGRVVVVGTRIETSLVRADGSLEQSFGYPPPPSYYLLDAAAADGSILLAYGNTLHRFIIEEDGFHFAMDHITVRERTRRLVPLKVLRSGDVSQPASVQIAAGQGTAEAGRDWVLIGLGADLPRTLLFPIGVRFRTVYLAVRDDRVSEGLETASFFLTRPRGAALATPDTLQVDILD